MITCTLHILYELFFSILIFVCLKKKIEIFKFQIIKIIFNHLPLTFKAFILNNELFYPTIKPRGSTIYCRYV